MATIFYMMKYIHKIKIDVTTYFFLLACYISGFIKESLVIMFICVWHEVGHLIIGVMLQKNISSLKIYPFGGILVINDRINNSIKKELLLALGGIMNQLILLIIIFYFRQHLDDSLYNMLIRYNLIIIIFNLMPIYPLDGYKIIINVMKLKISYYYSLLFSQILSLICLFLFLILLIYFKLYTNLYMVIILSAFSIKKVLLFRYEYQRFLVERLLYNFDYSDIKYSKFNVHLLMQGK